MWATLEDTQKEYNINLDRIISFIKTRDCAKDPCIELIIPEGGITLIYYSEEERDYTYDQLKLMVNSYRILKD